MSWFTKWLFGRALRVPTAVKEQYKKMNSGGDLVRLFKEPLFVAIDSIGEVTDASTLTNDIVKNMKLNDMQKLIIQLFLMGVVEKAVSYANGKIERLRTYLKNYILTC